MRRESAVGRRTGGSLRARARVASGVAQLFNPRDCRLLLSRIGKGAIYTLWERTPGGDCHAWVINAISIGFNVGLPLTLTASCKMIDRFLKKQDRFFFVYTVTCKQKKSSHDQTEIQFLNKRFHLWLIFPLSSCYPHDYVQPCAVPTS